MKKEVDFNIFKAQILEEIKAGRLPELIKELAE